MKNGQKQCQLEHFELNAKNKVNMFRILISTNYLYRMRVVFSIRFVSTIVFN